MDLMGWRIWEREFGLVWFGLVAERMGSSATAL